MRPSGAALGIDVVDLDDPRSVGRAREARLLARILTPAEAGFVRDAPEPDLALWALWAGKEAAFKTVTLLEGAAPVFRHRAFEVTLAHGLAAGTVTYAGHRLPLHLSRRGRALVALCWGPGPGGGAPAAESDRVPGDLHWALDDAGPLARSLGVSDETLDGLRAHHLRPAEARAVHSRASALARLALRRDAARLLVVDEARLAVVCAEGPPGRVPPELQQDRTTRTDVAVSLSHHGRWVAWGVRLSECGDDTAGAG
jgi:phosphopantetheinyl transferase (holo-ACP synthase)